MLGGEFMAHLAVEPDANHHRLRTDQGPGADNHEAAVGKGLRAAKDQPVTVLADSLTAQWIRAVVAQHGHIDRVNSRGLPKLIPGGFTVDDFTVDHENPSAICRNGLACPINPAGVATFGAACTNA